MTSVFLILATKYQVFVQQFIQANNKGNVKFLHYWPRTGPTKASNAVNFSLSWRHQGEWETPILKFGMNV